VIDHPSRRFEAWRIAAQSMAVALIGYLAAGAAEIGLIRTFSPSEPELAWVSDVVLSVALGAAVYLWLHLKATRQALAERERNELVLNTQLALAADLQRRLLPELPQADARVQWAAALRPAGRIGGDFYDVVSPADGEWLLLVADVSGKGIPAAMALSTLRATFRTLATSESDPAAILSRLSAALYEQWAGTPYVTAIVARIDLRAETIRYANAAHPAGLVAGPSGVRSLESMGLPAALFPAVAYEERTIAIEPGDVCVFVSDGVTEALGDRPRPRLEDIVRAADIRSARARDVCDALMAAALRGTGPEGVADWQDDRTVVVIEVLAPAVPVPVAAGAMPESRESWPGGDSYDGRRDLRGRTGT
jgi:sigma-B regulation protein RsbU (phosphoserine phosphatase)